MGQASSECVGCAVWLATGTWALPAAGGAPGGWVEGVLLLPLPPKNLVARKGSAKGGGL